MAKRRDSRRFRGVNKLALLRMDNFEALLNEEDSFREYSCIIVVSLALKMGYNYQTIGAYLSKKRYGLINKAQTYISKNIGCNKFNLSSYSYELIIDENENPIIRTYDLRNEIGRAHV